MVPTEDYTPNATPNKPQETRSGMQPQTAPTVLNIAKHERGRKLLRGMQNADSTRAILVFSHSALPFLLLVFVYIF
jgi:hypothetical protein